MCSYRADPASFFCSVTYFPTTHVYTLKPPSWSCITKLLCIQNRHQPFSKTMKCIHHELPMHIYPESQTYCNKYMNLETDIIHTFIYNLYLLFSWVIIILYYLLNVLSYWWARRIMCVCVCVCAGGWEHACVRACVCVCVYIVIVKYSLYLSGF